MVRSAVANENNTNVTEEKASTSFFEIWETIIHELKTNDNGTRFTTSESYECALNGKNGVDCYSKNGHAVTVLTRQS